MAIGAAAVGLLTAGVAAPASGEESATRSVAAVSAVKDARQTGTGPLARVGGVPISAMADSATRKIAEASPQAVTATANLCGTGYNLQYAEQLPTSTQRLGTLFTYQTNVEPFNACAVFDNNTGTTKWMKLKLCPSSLSGTCVTDEGNFSQYAGPVRLADGWCSRVTALMKNSSASTTYLINRQLTIRCD
ncbi:hypothetical protein [Streptomyces sp. NPDC002394]